MTTLILVLLAIVLLISGRKLFWLFVGIIGFIIGIALATLLFPTESELALLAIALIAGVFCAILSGFVPRLAVGVAGFIAGGYIVTGLIGVSGWELGLPNWLLFIIGGAIGALLVAVLFEPALILLSSLTGASLLIQTLEADPWVSILLFFGSLAAGIAIQAAGMRADRTAS